MYKFRILFLVGSESHTVRLRPSLKYFQNIIGGKHEIIHLQNGMVLLIDKEGKLKQKHVNMKATNLMQKHAKNPYKTDFIVGIAIYCEKNILA